MDHIASVTDAQLDNIQGDVWSKGFTKFFETYYFFHIKSAEAKLFPGCLKQLVEHSPTLIPTLRDVRDERLSISDKKDKAVKAADAAGILKRGVNVAKEPVSNALIAFTYRGLEIVQQGLHEMGLSDDSLDLLTVEDVDPAFCKGMASDTKLGDPGRTTWDPLFQSADEIHGLLKIAGSSREKVDQRLKEIQEVLKHDKVIKDVSGKSPPTTIESRVDGWTRPKDRGKEHFGFEDGISQPRMKGIDDPEPDPDKDAYATVNMTTPPHILIVTKDTHVERHRDRPEWMYDGSFLVFRKLEQDVKAFEALTRQWDKFKCESPEHMGAKLMGRWPSGAAIALRKDGRDPRNVGDPRKYNNFGFGPDEESCPFSAHIRKTNLRIKFSGNDSDQQAARTRIIRSGIAYGSDYKGNENDGSTRGLLFACYQGHIEDGFQNMQAHWSNEPKFHKSGTGHDPIVGQVRQKSDGVNGDLTTFFTDRTNDPAGKQRVTFQQLVTLKGGEYFFVPSIKALGHALAGVEE